MRCLAFIPTSIGILILSAAGNAQCSETPILPPAPQHWGLFGNQVELEGDRILISEPGSWHQGQSDVGVVHAYERVGMAWIHVQTLTASDFDGNADFGMALSMQGDTAVVGSPGSSQVGTFNGAAYVFEHSAGSWNETQLLVPPGVVDHHHFGRRVLLLDDRLFVSSEQPDATGAVYVFERSGGAWTLTDHLIASDGEAGDRFGCDLAAGPDILAVGAYFVDTPLQRAGAAYVFERVAGAWVETARFTSPSPQSSGFFGASLALQNDLLVIGAPSEDGALPSSGVVYAVRREAGGWTAPERWSPSDPYSGDRFGAGLDIDGDLLAISAPSNIDRSSVYLFEREGEDWIERTKLRPDDVDPDFGHGGDPEIDGNMVLVGTPTRDSGWTFSGGAYIWSVAPDFVVSYCEGAPNSAGRGETIGVTGPSSISANAFGLRTFGGVPGQMGLFLYAQQGTQVPFGDGFRCITFGSAGGIRLNPTQAADAAGESARWIDFEIAPAGSGAGTIHPGSTWYFQHWYRDPNGPGGTGFNASDGVRVRFCP